MSDFSPTHHRLLLSIKSITNHWIVKTLLMNLICTSLYLKILIDFMKIIKEVHLN